MATLGTAYVVPLGSDGAGQALLRPSNSSEPIGQGHMRFGAAQRPGKKDA
jgi:hypothetical protein